MSARSATMRARANGRVARANAIVIDTNTDADVIVVGAGAAGLAAALWLAERSVRVIVLEGRTRLGGRVQWQSVGTVDVPAELGAEFIHGAAPETSAFLREAGLAKIETGGTSSWTWSSAAGLQPEVGDAIAGTIFERAQCLTADKSVAAFLHCFENDPRLHEEAQRAKAFVEGFEAADPALASVRSIADEIRMGADSTTARPVGSYAPLFEYLGARCERAGVEFFLSTAVERVEWQSGKVTIEARSSDGAAYTFRSRCSVITVPVGVLRQSDTATQLSFAPSLPAEKEAALRGLEMGHAVRVTLAFRTPFWEELVAGRYRNAAFFRSDGSTFHAFWTQMPQRSRTIVAWAGGPRATAMNGTAARERVDRALDEFAAMFAERDLAHSEFEGGVTHDWSTDPFACGAYSYVATGGDGARAALGTPVDDTLFFAGEATATDGQGGTVSGAFGTGLRAAVEAGRVLGIASAPSQRKP